MISVNLPVPAGVIIVLIVMFCITQILNYGRRLFTIQPPGVPLKSILIGAGIDVTLFVAWVAVLGLFITNLK